MTIYVTGDTHSGFDMQKLYDWELGHMHNDRDCDDKHTLLYNKIVELGQGVEHN